MSRSRHQHLNREAKYAAEEIQRHKECIGNVNSPIGIILGTGWGDSIEVEDAIELGKLNSIFANLQTIPGHARKIGIANIAGHKVVVLSGRVHMYEGNRDAVYLMARVMWELGVRKLVLTNAAGGMRDYVEKGDIVVINDIIGRGPVPIDGPPFADTHSMLRQDIARIIWEDSIVLKVHIGHYVYNQGPEFESPGDRLHIDRPGVLCVGMSCRPEAACFASFVEQEGLKPGKDAYVVAISCISNGLVDTHGHATNTAVLKQNSARLGQMLKHVVRMISDK